MLSDTQTVTINSVAHSLSRTQMDGLKSIYESADGLDQLTVSHQISKDGRVRTMARFDKRKVVTNPLDSSNDYDSLAFYVVVDRPGFGFSIAEVQQLAAGFKAWLDDTTIEKLYGKQS